MDLLWKKFLFIDIFIFLSVTTLLALVEFGVIPNNQIGFYCDDPSISFQFMGDTISLTVLLVGTFVLPIIFTLGIEWALVHSNYFQDVSCDSDEEDNGERVFTKTQPLLQSSKCKSQEAKAAIAYMWPWYRDFLLGFGINILITDIAKAMVGEPRPHFLDTCRPDLAKNCTTGYIQGYKCTNTWSSIWEVRDATKSFPSGHASISVYTALFMMWFIEKRIPGRPTYLLVPFLHCLWILWALLCSLTRIIDHRHHWWDVLAGTVLGIAITVFTVKTQCKYSTAVGVSSKSFSGRGVQLPKKPPKSCSGIGRGEMSVGLHERHHTGRRLLSSSSGTVEESEINVVLP